MCLRALTLILKTRLFSLWYLLESMFLGSLINYQSARDTKEACFLFCMCIILKEILIVTKEFKGKGWIYLCIPNAPIVPGK